MGKVRFHQNFSDEIQEAAPPEWEGIMELTPGTRVEGEIFQRNTEYLGK